MHRFLSDEIIHSGFLVITKLKTVGSSPHLQKHNLILRRDKEVKGKKLKLTFSNLSLRARAKTACFEGLTLCYY